MCRSDLGRDTYNTWIPRGTVVTLSPNKSVCKSAYSFRVSYGATVTTLRPMDSSVYLTLSLSLYSLFHFPSLACGDGFNLRHIHRRTFCLQRIKKKRRESPSYRSCLRFLPPCIAGEGSPRPMPLVPQHQLVNGSKAFCGDSLCWRALGATWMLIWQLAIFHFLGPA